MSFDNPKRSVIFLTAFIFSLFLCADLLFAAPDTNGTAPPEPKQLNNFVIELLHLENIQPQPVSEFKFMNPKNGWVFISSSAQLKSGKVTITIDSASKDDAVIVQDKSTGEPAEAMRFLPAGDHSISIHLDGDASIHTLIVRSIPEIAYCKFLYNPHVKEYGPYDWDYLKKHVLMNVNTVVGGGDPSHDPYIREWKKQGKRWMLEYGVPGLAANSSLTVDEAVKYWTENIAFQNPLYDGLLADEFLDRPDEKYAVLTEAIKRIAADSNYKNKSIYPYWGPSLYAAGPVKFAKTVVKAGYRFSHELYLKEQPSEAEAKRSLEYTLKLKMKEWKTFIPHAENYVSFALGYLSAPPESLNANPAVDYKVWMDMQFNYLANEPIFKNLNGVLEYTSGYADEEIVRWASKLYRHYCIEGKRDMLSDSPYMLDHIVNPDFDSGLDGWILAPAEKDSIQAKSMKGYSYLQGRYPSSAQGDNFLWTKRNAKMPNVFSQEIKHLQPGKLYSLKMYTADYGELIAGKSVEQKHAISIKIDNTEVLPDANKSFQHVFPNCYGHSMGPFDDNNKAWMNYHQRVFRAQGETAKLMISDWSSDTQPGGAIGQELIFNFIEIQPYMDDK